MTTTRPSAGHVWHQCAHVGCTAGIGVRPEHADNFDGRAWRCPEHEVKR